MGTETSAIKTAAKKSKATTNKELVKKAAAPTAKTNKALSAEQRHNLVCETAYFIAEKNGFDESRSLEFWLQAENEVDSQLLEK